MEWFKGFVALLIALTFTACFIGVLHYTSFEQNHTHDWPSSQTQAQQTRDNQNDMEGVKPLSPKKPYQSTSAYPSDNSLQQYDHTAQIFMVGAAVFGTIIAIIGLLLLGWTLRETRKAASSANKTLNVARSSFSETKSAVRAELKAYMALEGVSVKILEPNGNSFFAIELTIKNVGNTPAFNIVAHCIPFTSNNRESKTPFKPKVKNHEKMVAGYLPQNTKAVSGIIVVQGVEFSLTSDEGGGLERTNNADTFIIAEGVIEFDDIYTVDDPNIPKRTLVFHRYIGTATANAYGATFMRPLAWVEKAT